MLEAKPVPSGNAIEDSQDDATSTTVSDSAVVNDEEAQNEAKADAQRLADMILFSLLQMENCTRWVTVVRSSGTVNNVFSNADSNPHLFSPLSPAVALAKAIGFPSKRSVNPTLFKLQVCLMYLNKPR